MQHRDDDLAGQTFLRDRDSNRKRLIKLFSRSNAPSIPRHSDQQPIATRGMMDRIGRSVETVVSSNALHKTKAVRGGDGTALVVEDLDGPAVLPATGNDFFPTLGDSAKSSRFRLQDEACRRPGLPECPDTCGPAPISRAGEV